MSNDRRRRRAGRQQCHSRRSCDLICCGQGRHLHLQLDFPSDENSESASKRGTLSGHVNLTLKQVCESVQDFTVLVLDVASSIKVLI